MKRLLRRCTLLSVLVVSLYGRAEEPVYVELPGSDGARQTVRSEPIAISGYPTILSMALAREALRLRAIDVNGDVRQWSVNPPEAEGVIFRLDEEPVCAALSPDAKWVASADAKGVVSLTNAESRELVLRDEGLTDNTVAIVFSMNSQSLASVTSQGIVRVWDVESRELTDRFQVLPGSVQSVCFSDEGDRLAVASFTRDVALFELGNPHRVATLSIDQSRITAVAFAPQSDQLLIASADGSLRLVDVEEPRSQRKLASHPFAIWTMAFDGEGRLTAGSWDGKIRIWDTSNWELIQSVKAHHESICAILLGAEGMVSAGMDGQLFYWPPELPSLRASGLIRGSSQVWVTAVSPNGKQLYVGGGGNRSERWDLESKTRLGSGPLHPTVRCATFSPDSQLLATAGDDRTVVIASAQDGSVVHRLTGHPGLVSALVFTGDGKTLISGCDGGFLKFWDVQSGKEIASHKKHQQQLYCAAISPDERWLITGGGHWAKGDPGELIVWDLKQKRFVKSLNGHALTVWSIVFAPDGSFFATSDSKGEVKRWSAETLELQETLRHQTWLRPLAMSPDGKTLAVGRGDGSIRLWDTTTWQQKSVCAGHENFTFWLTYSPDGRTLISGGDDGTVRFWRVE